MGDIQEFPLLLATKLKLRVNLSRIWKEIIEEIDDVMDDSPERDATMRDVLSLFAEIRALLI